MESRGTSASSRRAKRYLSEVQHILERVLDDETVPVLLQAESNFTVQGLSSRVAKLQTQNSELQDEISQLKREAETASQLPSLKLQLAELQASRVNLEREIETCKHEYARQIANEDFKRSSLSRELECCKENLESKEVLLLKYKEGFNELDNELRQSKSEIVRLQNEVTQHKSKAARAEHSKETVEGGLTERLRSQEHAVARIQREQKQTMKEAEDRFELEVKGYRLRAEAAERTTAEYKAQISSVEAERQSIREARDLVLKGKQLQDALAAEQRLSEKQKRTIEELQIKQAGFLNTESRLQGTVQEKDMLEARLIAVEGNLDSWRQIAHKFLPDEVSEESMSSVKFASYLTADISRRQKSDQDVLELRSTLIETQAAVRDEISKASELQRQYQESEIKRARMVEELKRIKRLHIRLKTAVKAGTATQIMTAEEELESDGTSSSNPKTDLDETAIQERLIQSLNKQIQRLNAESEAASAYQAANAKLQMQVEALSQSKESSVLHNKRLSSKISKLQAVVSDLTAQNRLLAPSVEEREGLEDDKRRITMELEEALKKNRLLREYFKCEAAETQIAIGDLFGWNVRSSSETESMTLTLSSKFAPRGDDAEIRFSVARQPPDLKQKALAGAAKGQVEMQLLGRYAAKWETDKRWQNILAESKSYPSFLAFTCIEEFELDLSRRRTSKI